MALKNQLNYAENIMEAEKMYSQQDKCSVFIVGVWHFHEFIYRPATLKPLISLLHEMKSVPIHQVVYNSSIIFKAGI